MDRAARFVKLLATRPRPAPATKPRRSTDHGPGERKMTPSPEPGAEENGGLPLIGYCVDLRLRADPSGIALGRPRRLRRWVQAVTHVVPGGSALPLVEQIATLYRAGRRREALDACRRLLAFERRADVMALAGNIAMELAEVAEAAARYAAACKPDFAEAQYNLGNALMKRGRRGGRGPSPCCAAAARPSPGPCQSHQPALRARPLRRGGGKLPRSGDARSQRG